MPSHPLADGCRRPVHWLCLNEEGRGSLRGLCCSTLPSSGHCFSKPARVLPWSANYSTENFCSATGVVPATMPVLGVFSKHHRLIVAGWPVGDVVVKAIQP